MENLRFEAYAPNKIICNICNNNFKLDYVVEKTCIDCKKRYGFLMNFHGPPWYGPSARIDFM